ncbi:MAG: radical SAM family heme chaperone HemW [Sphaerochaetaceae bacterium]
MLSIPALRPLSLYLHVPFCTTRCAYCAFYSEPETKWKGLREQYVERLEKEIKTVVQQIGEFETIFIGGGNPGSLQCDQIARLLEAADSRTCREVTIEMNPETFTEQLEPLFSKGLVTRLSMGIQSMDASVLRQLGRNTTVKENLRAIKLAGEVRKAYGIDLSFDLMTALPGQSIQMAQKDIETLVSLCDVDHLSLYCLTVEEGTELAQKVASKELSVFDDDGQRVLLQSLWNQLHEMGYTHYEVSNFAKHNAECKHNLVYWNLEPYLGLGCSAASLLRE